ncbi:Ribonuclease III [Gracilaria domingensis]|nr:Ribonuclease III [Gracilaria domingensis]
MSATSDSDAAAEPPRRPPPSRQKRHKRRRHYQRRSSASEYRFTLDWGSDSDSTDCEPLSSESSTGSDTVSSSASYSMVNLEELDEVGASFRVCGPSQSAPALLPKQDIPLEYPRPALTPRRYQLEILQRAKETNVIAVLDTGAGKTLVAALLVKETLQSLHNVEMAEKSTRASSVLPHSSPSFNVVSSRIISAVDPEVDASLASNQFVDSSQLASLDAGVESEVAKTVSELSSCSADTLENTQVENLTLDTGKQHLSQMHTSSDRKPHSLGESSPENGAHVLPANEPDNRPGPSTSNDSREADSEFPLEDLTNSASTLFNITKNTLPTKQVVFVVHRVALVPQQAKVLRSVLPPEHRVAVFYGEKSGDDWSSSEWIHKLRSKTVLVMTAQILLNLLRHGILDMQNVSLLILDEVHHATGNHPFSRIFVEFYHTIPKGRPRPRVFGMTATPVKRKAQASSELNCLYGMCALEATLDAKIVTLSDDHNKEFDEHVPKPEELVLTYHGKREGEDVDEFQDYELESRVLSKFERYNNPEQYRLVGKKVMEGNEVKAISSSGSETEDISSFQADEMKVILHVCRKLGIMAAHDFAVRLSQASGVDPQKVVTELLSDCGPAQMDSGGMPEKVSKLLDLLFSEWLRCEEGANASNPAPDGADVFRCIVFIHERSCALALAWLINTVFQHLNKNSLRAKSVVGCHSTESLVRMSRSRLIRTVEEFRNGDFGILVATNVVEEGLNVPACRLVVSFDVVKSPTAYVQARGRARKRNARYVVFVEERNRKCFEAFLAARRGADLMNQVAKGNSLSEGEKESLRASYLADNIVKEEMLCSFTTNAKVGPTQAVCLLEKYCSIKSSQWDVDNLRPEYVVTEESNGFLATVKINKKSGIDGGFCTEPQKTETLARRHAALDAYRKLYEIGEVDSYLLPRRPSRSQRVLRTAGLKPETGMRIRPVKSGRRREREVPSKASKKDKRVRRCNIIHPSVLQLEASDSKCQIQADNNQDSPSVGPEATIQVEPSCSTPYGSPEKVPTKLYMYVVELDCDMSGMAWYESHKDEHFALLVREQLPDEDLTAVRCPTGRKLLSLVFQKEIQWSVDLHKKAQKYVLFLQLCLWGRTPGSLKALEVEAEEKERGSVAGFLLMPLTKTSHHDYMIDWKSVDRAINLKWRKKPNREEGIGNPQTFEHALVCSSHEDFDRVYVTGCADHELRADSTVEGYLNADMYKTFADYYRDRHDVILENGTQAMLPGSSVRSTMNQLTISFFMLPPEICNLIPISPHACFITSMLPAWQTFLAIRNCWRKNSVKECPAAFLSFAKALQPNISYVTKGVADLSYERLEFLGDAVLKVLFSMVTFVGNPSESEGILSDIRDIEVSNQRLADLAMQMKLHDCVAFSGVSQNVRSWPWFWASQTGDQIRISEKVLADCVEALLGVQYLHGGMKLVTAFVDKHKLMPGASRILGFTMGSDANGVVLPVPPMGPGDKRYEADSISKVEEILGYTFRDKRHLVIALTHGSFENGYITSYQRYEYLGDAIIGFLLLSHFFNEYPSFSPGELTSLRGPALSNDLFARVIVSKGIHRSFWYDCAPLKREIEKFAKLVANEEDDDEDVCKTMTVPKVLGDLLESIVGAIVVDKGMRLDGVQEIVLRLMEDELNRFANPSKFRRNPISELVCIVQKRFRTKGPKYLYLDNISDLEKICVVLVEDKGIGKGVGPTRRIARRRASVAALNALIESSAEGSEVDQQIEECPNDEDTKLEITRNPSQCMG